jgi:hypothetical protein
MIRNILIITIIAALVPTAMSNVSASASTEIALFSSDSDSLSISGNGDNARMELKATNENGKTIKVSDFQLTADNVLYIKTGDMVTVKDKVDFTKAITTDGNNNQKVIGITSNGVIDFTGYTQGVSTLDVVVDDDRAYEAIIVIGQQPPEVINKEITRVNNKYVTDVSFRTFFKFPDMDYDDKCSSKLGSAGLDYPYDKKTQCEKEEYDQCEEDEKNGLAETDRCDELEEGFFDDCEGFANSKECAEYWSKPPRPEPKPIVGICFNGDTPVNGYCPSPSREPACDALGCPGSPSHIAPTEPLYYEEPEPEPEPTECDESEELVDGQCQLIATNPEEPYDLVSIEEEELDDPEEELDEVPEEEAEEESGGSEDEVENDDDEEGGGDSEESNEGEESDDSSETSE